MNYECNKCKKRFTRKYNLDVHCKRKFSCVKMGIEGNNHVITDETHIVDNTLNRFNIASNTSQNQFDVPCIAIFESDFPSNDAQNTPIQSPIQFNEVPITSVQSNISSNKGQNTLEKSNISSNILFNISQVISDNSAIIPDNFSTVTDKPPIILDNLAIDDSTIVKDISNNTKKIHQCLNCLKIFSRNNILQKHINNNCKGQDTKKIQCDYCLHNFFSPSNLKKHIKKGCKLQPINNDINNDINMDFIDSDDSDDSDDTDVNENINVNELLKKLKTLEEENEKLNEKLKNQKEPSITYNTNTNTNTNSNNNITINNTQNITNNTQNIILVEFGKEKINEVLTHEEKIKIFERGFNSVTVLTKQIHFNEKFPQYNNCYISNRRDNVAIVYDGKGWGAIDVTDVVQTLIDNGKCYLETEYNESKEKYDTTENNKDKNKILSEKAITQFSRYLDKKDDKELKKRYDKETKLMMYNNRNVVMKNKKGINNK
jgi:hypothetical protein